MQPNHVVAAILIAAVGLLVGVHFAFKGAIQS